MMRRFSSSKRSARVICAGDIAVGGKRVVCGAFPGRGGREAVAGPVEGPPPRWNLFEPSIVAELFLQG